MPSSSLIWLLGGSVLCLTELFLPSAFVCFIMGTSALMVGLLSYLGIGNLWIQVAAWLLLSTTLTILSRRFLQPRRRKSLIQDALGEQNVMITKLPYHLNKQFM